MKNNMLCIIDATTYSESLHDLTSYRSLAALPFLGRYRLIDFPLSNAVNSSITNVAIITKYHHRAILDHLGSGKSWDLDRKNDGLFIFPSELYTDNDYTHSLRVLNNHIDYLKRSSQEYVVLTNCYTICYLDFEQILRFHLTHEQQVTSIVNKGNALDIYIIRKDLLIELIEGYSFNDGESMNEIIYKGNAIVTFEEYEHSDFVAKVNSLKSYYENSMQLLKAEYWKQLFRYEKPIFTKVKDEPPTFYGENSSVSNSLIANGCVINGRVENSIIFRGAIVEENAIVRNSIIMQRGKVLNSSVLEKLIIDKDIIISNECNFENEYPKIIPKGYKQGAMINT
ncbi:MAG: glgD [Bacillales bacterium]|nr:glgD [Bacillales bacterium]